MLSILSSAGAMRLAFRSLFCCSNVASVWLLTATGYVAAGPLAQTRETIFVPPVEDARIVDVAMRRGGGGAHRAVAVHPNRPVARPNVRPDNVVIRKNNVVRNTNALVRPGGWVRPANYWWRPGAAVAAGAAIGFVSAATAAAWAGSPPGPGYCWYYTDASRTQGFWDQCP
jgi:hypothetical protein